MKSKGFRGLIKTLICVLACIIICGIVLNALRKDRVDRSFDIGGNCGTTYEIFVGSFCDSNGDGTGDLNGIRSKLDYIEDLGFDGIWLTPVQPSATYHKYDADDYCAIDPAFGTMEDYEALLDECHKRGLKVYMDLVLNHTSEDHEWFKAASDYLHELPWDWEPDTSYCKYFDYYNFRRDPAEGYVPLEGTGWYYEARFWSEMPDLDLNSDAVKEEVRDILAFWLGKGVDGFRLDAVTSYFADDTAANSDFLRFLADTAKSIDPDCYLVGEAWTDTDTIAYLYGSGIDSLFDFPFAGSDGVIARTVRGESGAETYVDEMICSDEMYRRADPNYIRAPFYTNHDMDRSAEYYPDSDEASVKMAYAMDLLMAGNAFVYYGEELGMTGGGKDENRRGPMYWSNDSADADMCEGPPNMDYIQMKYPSAADQMKDERSVYNWFRALIRIRNEFPAIARGTTEKAGFACDDSIAAFFRNSDEYDNILIVINLRNDAKNIDLSQLWKSYKLVETLSVSGDDVKFKRSGLYLPGYSIAVFSEKN